MGCIPGFAIDHGDHDSPVGTVERFQRLDLVLAESEVEQLGVLVYAGGRHGLWDHNQSPLDLENN